MTGDTFVITRLEFLAITLSLLALFPLGWRRDGKFMGENNQFDLVEYLGPELPEPKRKVKMAPCLRRQKLSSGVQHYYIGDSCYQEGQKVPDDTIRHLIGTPYEIEVEVEE